MLIYLSILTDEQSRSKLENIYKMYKNLMYYVAYQILHSKPDSEDAVHQAFLSIIEHIEKISDPICAKTQSYVVTVVERKAIDIYRQKAKKTTISLEDIENTLSIDAELVDPVALAIAKLPAKARHLIQFKYYFGYSNQEVADILGLSYEGVHSLDQRTKKRLKELLAEEGVNYGT